MVHGVEFEPSGLNWRQWVLSRVYSTLFSLEYTLRFEFCGI